ncbi:MAG: hypothetical protein Q9184_007329 [Pyrenodesmia sp. 2 TL-2023]
MAVGHIEDKEAHGYTVEDDTDRSSGFSDPIGVLVEQKWRGTVQDKTDMEILGRGQVLRTMTTLGQDKRGYMSPLVNTHTFKLIWILIGHLLQEANITGYPNLLHPATKSS